MELTLDEKEFLYDKMKKEGMAEIEIEEYMIVYNEF